MKAANKQRRQAFRIPHSNLLQLTKVLLFLMVVSTKSYGQSSSLLLPLQGQITDLSNLDNYVIGTGDIISSGILHICEGSSISAQLIGSALDSPPPYCNYNVVYPGFGVIGIGTLPPGYIYISPTCFTDLSSVETINLPGLGMFTVQINLSVPDYFNSLYTTSNSIEFKVVVHDAPDLMLSVTNVNPICFQPDLGTNVNFNFANAYAYPFDSYSMDFGDGSGTIPGIHTSHMYFEPGNYTVTLTNHHPCGDFVTTTSVTLVDCCNINPPSTLLASVVSDNPLYDADPDINEVSITVPGTLKIDVDKTIAISNFKMLPNSKIVVDPGIEFITSECNFDVDMTCPNPKMWYGIYTNDNSYLYMENCRVSHAKCALTTNQTDLFELHDNIFNNNFRHLYINNINVTFSGLNIQGNEFKCDDLLIAPYNTIPKHTYIAIFINNCFDFHLTETNITKQFDQFGIFAFRSNVKIMNQGIGEFNLSTASVYSIGILGRELHTSFFSPTSPKVFHVENNFIINGVVGIYADKNLTPTIMKNRIQKMSKIGIYTFQSNAGTVHNEVKILENTIHVPDNTVGILLSKMNNSYSNVELNRIIFTYPSISTVGIKYYETMNYNKIFYCANNKITNAHVGIDTYYTPFSKGTQIVGNSISLVTSSGAVGLRNSYCKSLLISCNKIHTILYGPALGTVAYQPRTTGIHTNYSNNTKVYCNDILNMQESIRYEGSSVINGKIKGNQMLNCQVGLMMNYESYLGTQLTIDPSTGHEILHANRWGALLPIWQTGTGTTAPQATTT